MKTRMKKKLVSIVNSMRFDSDSKAALNLTARRARYLHHVLRTASNNNMTDLRPSHILKPTFVDGRRYDIGEVIYGNPISGTGEVHVFRINPYFIRGKRFMTAADRMERIYEEEDDYEFEDNIN